MDIIYKFVEDNKKTKIDEIEIIFKNISRKKIFENINIFGKKSKFTSSIKTITPDNLVIQTFSKECKCPRERIYIKNRRRKIDLTAHTRITYKTEIEKSNIKKPTPSQFNFIKGLIRFTFDYESFQIDLSFVKSENISNKGMTAKKILEVKKLIMETLMKDKSRELETFGKKIPLKFNIELEIELKKNKVDKNEKELFENFVKTFSSWSKINKQELQNEMMIEARSLGAQRYADIYNKVIDLNEITFAKLNDLKSDSKSGYAVSYKKDGLRTTFYIDILGNLKISLEDTVDTIFIPKYSVGTTIIDAEYIKNDKMDSFILFDVSMFDRQLIEDNLPERLEILRRFTPILSEMISSEKKYENTIVDVSDFQFPSKTRPLDKIAEEMLAKENTLPYEIDGLIYTKIDGLYSETVLRWKPINTIDFVVVYTGGKRGEYYYNIYLYGSNDSRENDGNKTIRHENYPNLILVLFGNNVAQNRLKSKIKLKNYKIYELTYDPKRKSWKAVRERKNRDKPNYYGTGKKIFKILQNPITKKNITDFSTSYFISGLVDTPLMQKYKNFMNSTKYKIYERRMQGVKIITDIGTGRANDMKRWIMTGIKKVNAIEKNADAIKQGKERLTSLYSENIPTVKWFNSGFMEFLNNPKMRKLIKPNSQDAVIAFFSAHYFLETKNDYIKYISFISEILKPEKQFITIEINGKKIFDAIKKSKDNTFGKKRDDSDTKYLYSMKKTDIKGKFKLGLKTSVFISSIGTENTEFLVDLDYLISVAEKNGLKLIDRIPFNIFYKEHIKGRRKFEIFNKDLVDVAESNDALIFQKI